MRRLQIILSSMLETAVKSVVEGRPNLADEVLHMEEEADRIYWMIIRQLLLAVLDRRGGGGVVIYMNPHHLGDKGLTQKRWLNGGLCSSPSPQGRSVQRGC